MKKMGKLWMLFLMSIILIMGVQAQIQSTKNTYLSSEPVYVKSTAQLCNNIPPGDNVELYVVQNKEWTAGDSLNDARGDSQEIPNSVFSSKKIWNSPLAGDYDIIIDCIENGKYDSLEPIDSLFEIGFRVTAVAGKGKAEVGQKNIGNHSWMYDSEEPDLDNEMLQLSLLAEGEDIELGNITIKASGAGDDTRIDRLEIYLDENKNGKVDDNEIIIGDSQPAYLEDDGKVVLELDYTLTNNMADNILIVYTMKETISEGEFSLKVESLYGVGESSEKSIMFSGLPISSGVKTVLQEKTCLGTLTLELIPNPAVKDSEVIAKTSGLSGCQGEIIVLRLNPCGSSIKEDISSCIVGEEGCDISFNSSKSGTHHVCIDKNKDGDLVDFGEYAFEDLVVIEPVVESVNITEEVNVSEFEEGKEVVVEEEIEEEGEERAGITGSFIEDLAGTGSFFILLEVTLLLILFVLVMIMFRLKALTRIQKEKKE